MDQRAKRVADVLVNYSLDIKKGELVLIQGFEASIPFLKELYRKVLDKGAHPVVRVVFEDLMAYKMKSGSDDQLDQIAEDQKALMEKADVLISIMASKNTRYLSGVDMSKMRRHQQTSGKIQKIMMERVAKGELRWCGTLYPTDANAQEANMSLSDYEDFVYSAGLVDQEGAIEKWQKIKEEQERICKILDTKKHLRIVAKDTDITMSVEGRKWVNCCGHVNFPDGEVFTGPVENSVEGHIRFSFPGIYNGNEIEDIRLKFEKGKVVEASAAKGEDLLKSLIESDEGAKFVGEIAVGTNYGITRFTRNMLFDEKIGGTVHMALGFGIPESGSKNVSAIHWDMLCDMKDGEIYADGEVIYRDGKFLI